ncbi:MAG: CPBP family intramembrane metalloprotease [Chitinophagaceae bacterium]|jgi:membrane protease YdiL (CAAX protease family)|nr:CPBP family intramembrane metalloprotease [Chitinophagaceae bacterium]
MPVDLVFYWLLPAVPALLNLAVAWIVEWAWLRRRAKPWEAAHAARVGGIGIFLLAAWSGHASRQFSVDFRWASQFPVQLSDLLLVAGVIGVLYALQRRVLARRVPQGMEAYPLAGMSLQVLLVYACIWVLYLFLYESYFRGYLLQAALPSQPLHLVILYNTALYALVHINKNVQQILAAIPFGLLLCAVTLWTGHLWFAWVSHLWLALGFELPLLAKKNRSSVVNSTL